VVHLKKEVTNSTLLPLEELQEKKKNLLRPRKEQLLTSRLLLLSIRLKVMKGRA
jgi:hypothetical protein